MELSDFRDWIIIIFGAVGVVATIVVLTLIVMVYAKVARILDSLQVAADNIRDTTSAISDVIVKPIMKVKSFIDNIRNAIDALVPSGTKKGGD